AVRWPGVGKRGAAARRGGSVGPRRPSPLARTAVKSHGQPGYPVAVPVQAVTVLLSVPINVPVNGDGLAVAGGRGAAFGNVTVKDIVRGVATLPAPEPTPNALLVSLACVIKAPPF